MTTTTNPMPPPDIRHPVVAGAIRIHRTTGDEDIWHGDDETDVHIFREDEDQPARWYAYPVVIAPHWAISADTSRLPASGDVPSQENHDR